MKITGLLAWTVIACLSMSVFALAQAQEDLKRHPSCKQCGMDRQELAHSRIYIEYDGGTSAGLCSLRCAAIEFAVSTDKKLKGIHVGDFNTKALINAEKAHWVIGGSMAGVMSERAKWAFERMEDAERFIKEKGGGMATFEEAMKAAYEDIYWDTKMIRDMRKMKMEHKHN